jgi:hypothetical protein
MEQKIKTLKKYEMLLKGKTAKRQNKNNDFDEKLGENYENDY